MGGELGRRPSPTTTDTSPPKKRPCTAPSMAELSALVDKAVREQELRVNELKNLRAKVQDLQDYRSSDRAEFELGKKEWEAEKKALNERLDREFNNFASELKDVLKKLCEKEEDLEKTCQERDRYRKSLEIGKKEWDAEKKALNERLDKGFDNFGAQLKEVMKNLAKTEAELQKTSQERERCQSSLELEKKEWEDEKIAMTQKHDRELKHIGTELKKVSENLTKCENELEKTSRERDGYRKSLGILKKTWKDEKKALTQRLNDGFNTYRAEQKEVPEILSDCSLEFGNKAPEAAWIKMVESIATMKKGKDTALELGKMVAETEKREMAESTASANKEKDKSNWPRWEAQETSHASAAMVRKEKMKTNWPRWGAQEASYASNPLPELQIGHRGFLG